MLELRHTFKKFKGLVPSLLLGVISIRTLYVLTTGSVDISGELYEYSISNSHYFAFTAITLNLITFFVYRPIYRYFLLITLTLGLFNVLNFTVDRVERAIGFPWLTLTYQPISLYIILLIGIIYNREIRIKLMNVTTPRQDQTVIKEQIDCNKNLEKFLETYKNKSSHELMEIVNDKRFTAVASQAAQQLLNERDIAKNELE